MGGCVNLATSKMNHTTTATNTTDTFLDSPERRERVAAYLLEECSSYLGWDGVSHPKTQEDIDFMATEIPVFLENLTKVFSIKDGEEEDYTRCEFCRGATYEGGVAFKAAKGRQYYEDFIDISYISEHGLFPHLLKGTLSREQYLAFLNQLEQDATEGGRVTFAPQKSSTHSKGVILNGFSCHNSNCDN